MDGQAGLLAQSEQSFTNQLHPLLAVVNKYRVRQILIPSQRILINCHRIQNRSAQIPIETRAPQVQIMQLGLLVEIQSNKVIDGIPYNQQYNIFILIRAPFSNFFAATYRMQQFLFIHYSGKGICDYIKSA